MTPASSSLPQAKQFACSHLHEQKRHTEVRFFVLVEMGRFELPSELGTHGASTVRSFSFDLK